jgi:hypothetical protein
VPRLCTVCTHPQRAYIDAALLYHQQSYRKIADHYCLAETSVWRHEHAHLNLSLELSKDIWAIEYYLNGHPEYAALDPHSQIPLIMDALSRSAYSIATALACGLLSPQAIEAIRTSLARHDQFTAQHPTREETTH